MSYIYCVIKLKYADSYWAIIHDRYFLVASGLNAQTGDDVRNNDDSNPSNLSHQNIAIIAGAAAGAAALAATVCES